MALDEHSFGIIPVLSKGGEWWVLLIKHAAGGHWSFPKGHANEGEDAKETATRELREETDLAIARFLSPDPLIESYRIRRQHGYVNKTVTYFVAEVSGEETHLQAEEIADAKWVRFVDAPRYVTFPQAQLLCQRALALAGPASGK